MRHRLLRSLPLRLLAIFAATAFALVALLVALFTQGLSSQWQRSIRPHLVQYVRYVQDDLGSPPEPTRADAIAARLPVTIAIYRDGRFVHATDGRPLALDELEFRPLPRRGHWRRPGDRYGDGPEGELEDGPREESRRESWHGPERVGQRTRAPAVRASIARERRREGAVLRIEQGASTVYYRLERPSGHRPRRADGLYAALAAVLLVLLASYLLIRRQLAPIGRIQRGVGRMGEGELDHRIALDGHDDLAELGHAIDAMAARINGMLDAKRQLLLAISHELRSPLARARVATALLPDSRQRERLEADLADMARLIEDLTESERLRTPHAALRREPLELVSLLAEELAPHGLEPTLLDLPEDRLPIVADAARLRVLVRNLVGNALRHGVTAGGRAEVTVTLSRVEVPTSGLSGSTAPAPNDTVSGGTGYAGTALLEVADLGPGIDPEQLDAVTEPFHRPDSARTRAGGGVGLGLSLARLVAEAHGGTLRVASDPANVPGTRVSVTLPLDVPAERATVRPATSSPSEP